MKLLNSDYLGSFCEEFNIKMVETDSIKKLSNSYKLSEDKTKIIGLNLDHNRFSEFPNLLFKLTDIEELSLRNCDITFIPDDILHLQKLKKINLRTNKLKTFPSILLDLNDLHYINITFNFIRKLTPEMQKFKGEIFWEKDWNMNENEETGLFLEGNPFPSDIKYHLIKFDRFNRAKNVKSDLIKLIKLQQKSKIFENFYIINFINDLNGMKILKEKLSLKTSKKKLIYLNFPINKTKSLTNNNLLDLDKILGIRQNGIETQYCKIR
jgi:Leucine-rich repeat (LRR) protein